MASKNNAAASRETELPETINQTDSVDSSTNTHMGELDKVRSILFGEQIKVYEERMQQIEANINQNLANVRSDIDQQIKDLDSRVKSQFDEMLELIGKETHSRESQKDLLQAEDEKVSAIFEDYKKVQDDKLGAVGESVKQSLQEEMKTIEKELGDKIRSLSDVSEKTFTKLEDDTLKRAQLAEMLAGLARQIAPEENS